MPFVVVSLSELKVLEIHTSVYNEPRLIRNTRSDLALLAHFLAAMFGASCQPAFDRLANGRRDKQKRKPIHTTRRALGIYEHVR